MIGFFRWLRGRPRPCKQSEFVQRARKFVGQDCILAGLVAHQRREAFLTRSQAPACQYFRDWALLGRLQPNEARQEPRIQWVTRLEPRNQVFILR